MWLNYEFKIFFEVYYCAIAVVIIVYGIVIETEITMLHLFAYY